jgi:hypothetical protein
VLVDLVHHHLVFAREDDGVAVRDAREDDATTPLEALRGFRCDTGDVHRRPAVRTPRAARAVGDDLRGRRDYATGRLEVELRFPLGPC